tara:strand:- start:140 stop:274 length:135 start_codon:yes stop_codon:yes gene_type:complete
MILLVLLVHLVAVAVAEHLLLAVMHLSQLLELKAEMEELVLVLL